MGATALGSNFFLCPSKLSPPLSMPLLLAFRGMNALVLVVLLAWGWLSGLGELGGVVQRDLRRKEVGSG